MKKPATPAVVYDLPTVSRFFRTVAFANAMDQHTRIKWVEYRDSSILNAIYAVLRWKGGPGTAEIVQPMEDIYRTTDELQTKYLNVWIDKLGQGGAMAGSQYVVGMTNLRNSSMEFVRNTFREAADINREIVAETGEGIKRLAKIKLGATTGVAVLGGGLGAAVAAGAISITAAGSAMITAVPLGFSVSCSLARTWEQGNMARAVALDLGKGGAEFGIGHYAEVKHIKAVADQAKLTNDIRSAQGTINKYSKRLAEEGWKKAQIRSAQNRVAGAQNSILHSKGAFKSASSTARTSFAVKVGAPLVFAAMDIWNGIEEYNETIRGI